ncbi:EamA family transporter [Kineococcus sp. SYSU DK005]|uniref:EamA family transporter n=1 Tax=Kineococcus sp. SYSU DK005 TaxID=3383126 RepID=UPI003D7DEC4C
MHPSERRVDLLLLAVAVVWGSSYPAAKLAVTAGGVLPVLALRSAVAALALAVVLALARRRPGRTELALGTVLGLSQAAVLGLETWGLAGTSAVNAGVLISTTLLLTPLLEGALGRRWLPPRFFAAAGLALAGVLLLLAGGAGGPSAPRAGDLLVLAAAAVRAAHVTALGHLTRRRPVDLLGLTLVQTAVGALASTAADPAAVLAGAAGAGAGGWAALAWLGLACSAFAFLAQSWAVRRTSAARAGLLLGTEPLWAVAVGAALGGERPGPLALAGAALVLAGTGWGRRVEARRRLSAVPPAPAPAPRGPRPAGAATT